MGNTTMIQDKIHSFIRWALWRSSLHPVFITGIIWMVYVSVILLFLNDVLAPVNLRWFFFLTVMVGIPVTFFLWLWITNTKISKKIKTLEPLELELFLVQYSKNNPSDIKYWLNNYFLPHPNVSNFEFEFSPFSQGLRRLAIGFAGCSFVFLFTYWFSPVGSHDLMFPGSRSAHLSHFSVEFKPGNVKIERGDTVTVSGKVIGSGLPLKLIIRSENQSILQVPIEFQKPFTHSVANIQSSFTYYLENDVYQSEVYRVTMVDRPFLQQFTLQVHPPPYTKKQAFKHSILDGNKAQIPYGSQIEVSIVSSKQVQSLTLIGWEKLPIQTSNNFIQTKRPWFHNSSLSVKMKDIDDLNNRDTLQLHLSIVPDIPPVIDLLYPRELNATFNRDLTLPIRVIGGDDYGIRVLKFRYKTHSEFNLFPTEWKEVIVKTFPSGETTFEYATIWKPLETHLIPEDWIEFQAGITDNFPFAPEGQARWTTSYRIRVAGVNEFFDRAQSITDQIVQDLNELKNQSESLQQQAEELQDQLRKNPEGPNFSELNKLKSLAEDFKLLEENIRQQQAKLDQALQELNQTQTLSSETLEKYLELQKILEEIQSPALAEYFKNMEENLNKLKKQDLLQAMQNLNLDNNDLKERLDRTIEALNQLKSEQLVKEVSQQAEQLAQQEQAIRQELQKEQVDFNKADFMQQQQTQALRRMDQALDRLEKNLQNKQGTESQQQQLKELKQFMKDQNLIQQSQDISKSAQSKNQEQSSEQAAQLSQQLQSLQEKSQQLESSIKQNDHLQTLKSLRNLLTSTNQINHMLLQNPPSKDPNAWGATFADQVSRGLSSILDSVKQITNKEPELGDFIAGELSSTLRLLDQSKNAYVNNQFGVGENLRTQSRGKLSGMIYRVLAQMAQKANQQGNKQNQGQENQEKSFMDAMRELANKQQQLNEDVLNAQQQMQQGGSQMSPERLAQMAAQQQAIQQQLRETMQKGNQSKENTGLGAEMSAVEKEMEEAAKELLKDIQTKTIERQQKILSRMLDSQKSTIEREFEEKRESFTSKSRFVGKDFQLNPSQTTVKPTKTVDDLSGFSSGYERLMRAYYQFLSTPSK